MSRDRSSLMFAVMLGLLLAAAPACAQTPPTVERGYVMPATRTWDMTAPNGAVYHILVSFPTATPPLGGFPVLYVLDGNALFAGFAEARRIQEGSDVGAAIVVGVGYPGDAAYDLRRVDDLTGAPPPPPYDVKLAGARYGGWDRFFDFLTGPLRAEIAQRFPINPERQALFGHSLGGLFAIHALFAHPDAFHAIIAASPSLFWQNAGILREEQAFTARMQAGKVPKVSRLLVVAGERDETLLEQWDPQLLATRLAPLSAYGLRSRFTLYSNEGHITVPSRAVTETLRFAFSWP